MTYLTPTLHSFQVMAECQIFANHRGWLFNAFARVIPCEYPDKRCFFIALPKAGNYTIVSSFVWTQYRNVTDGETEGYTDGQK